MPTDMIVETCSPDLRLRPFHDRKHSMRMALLVLGAAWAIAACTTAAPSTSPAPATSPASGAANSAKVSVTITGIKTVSGTIEIALYDEAGFASGKSAASASIPVTGATVTWPVDAVKPGVYAIKLYQDVNGDGEMNANPFGIPIEPYAFSNNAHGSFGPPKFDAAAFTVPGGETLQTIKLN